MARLKIVGLGIFAAIRVYEFETQFTRDPHSLCETDESK